jgi:hypothetical protein
VQNNQTPSVIADSRVSAGQNDSQNSHGKKRTAATIVVVALLVVAAVGGGGAYFVLGNKGGGSCPAVTTTALNDASAKQAYQNFVKALKTKDQSCVDRFSTDVFLAVRSQAYGATDGNWLNSKAASNSAVKDFLALPEELDTSQLLSSDYVRADIAGVSGIEDAEQLSGITVKYVRSDKSYDTHLNISFVTEGGEVLADDMQVVPAQLDNQ